MCVCSFQQRTDLSTNHYVREIVFHNMQKTQASMDGNTKFRSEKKKIRPETQKIECTHSAGGIVQIPDLGGGNRKTPTSRDTWAKDRPRPKTERTRGNVFTPIQLTEGGRRIDGKSQGYGCFTLSPRKYSLAGILALASFSAAFRFASSFASRRRNWCRFSSPPAKRPKFRIKT